MLLVAHDLNGNLKTIQPLQISDLNLCNTLTHQSIHFGENMASACQIDLRTLIEMSEKRPWFLNIYLNYTENSLNLLKSVPVLIKNAFTYNMVKHSFSTSFPFELSLYVSFSIPESIRSGEMAVGEAIFYGRPNNWTK